MVMVVTLRASPANHIRFSYIILFKQSWTSSSVNKKHIKTRVVSSDDPNSSFITLAIGLIS